MPTTARSARAISPALRVARSRTGLGLFAETPIRKGKFIIEYAGKRVRWNDVENLRNKYLFDLNTRWAIDGADRRNTARYINHSCQPNAIPYEVKGKIKIYAKKAIRPGDEITYDYGRSTSTSFSRRAAAGVGLPPPRRRRTSARCRRVPMSGSIRRRGLPQEKLLERPLPHAAGSAEKARAWQDDACPRPLSAGGTRCGAWPATGGRTVPHKSTTGARHTSGAWEDNA
jgi:SET domain-containing protein